MRKRHRKLIEAVKLEPYMTATFPLSLIIDFSKGFTEPQTVPSWGDVGCQAGRWRGAAKYQRFDLRRGNTPKA